MDAFIDDGYTETVGIDAVDGLHPEMEFTYRPFAGNEATEAHTLIRMGPVALGRGKARPTKADIEKEQKQAQVQKRLFDAILARVSKWSFAPERELSRENLAKLNGQLFQKFHNIVFGYDTPDYWLDEDGERREELANGKTMEEEDAKN